MFTKLHIQNYKSIHDLEIELGRVNVFIGENGCGKSNILEAVAMLSAAKENRLRNDDLADKGIRVARPDMMQNAFADNEGVTNKLEHHIYLSLQNGGTPIESTLVYNQHKKEYDDLNQTYKKLLQQAKGNGPAQRLAPFVIYEVQTNPLRGYVHKEAYRIPGRNGENLDLLLEQFTKEQWQHLYHYSTFIPWLAHEGIFLDKENNLRKQHLRLRSSSKLGFIDQYMAEDRNTFSVENANEGAMHILFYLALLISEETPPFFAIDNIENALNPYLCRVLLETLVDLSKSSDKQCLITTHNPAVLDGLDLYDDEQRLFVVRRNFEGHTVAKRITLKKRKEEAIEIQGLSLKLSELWMRGNLGGLPENF